MPHNKSIILTTQYYRNTDTLTDFQAFLTPRIQYLHKNPFEYENALKIEIGIQKFQNDQSLLDTDVCRFQSKFCSKKMSSYGLFRGLPKSPPTFGFSTPMVITASLVVSSLTIIAICTLAVVVAMSGDVLQAVWLACLVPSCLSLMNLQLISWWRSPAGVWAHGGMFARRATFRLCSPRRAPKHTP